jgi:hypothetical protein
MRRHRLKGNFGAKIRVIRDAIYGAPYGAICGPFLFLFLISVKCAFNQRFLKRKRGLKKTSSGLASEASG